MTSAYEIQRRADFARARSLADKGFAAMAREILQSYLPQELPPIVVEINHTAPRRR